MADLYEKLKRFKANTTHAAPPPAAEQEQESPTRSQPSSSVSSSLPAALRNIPGVMRARELAGLAEKRERKKCELIESLGFEEHRNELGVFARRDRVYRGPEFECDPCELSAPELVRLCGDDRLFEFDGSRLMFIDTETTGLAGGAGTVPFLIGAGWFEDGGFRVRQYFMRDYSEEAAALQSLEDDLSRFDGVATYNGKGFDIPLLQTRFLLNRKRIDLTGMPHFDLLYPARRFWRDAFDDCRLGTIESQVLGRSRGEDVPSELIPYIYFDFLRGQRMERVSPVLSHNLEDIVTLALLGARMCRMLRAPDEHCGRALELIGVSRCYDGPDEHDQAAAWLHLALERGELSPLDDARARYRLARLYKRMKQYHRAEPFWRALADEHGLPEACVELAKWLEHVERDFIAAIEWTDKALLLIDRGAEESGAARREALMHRRARLESKQMRGAPARDYRDLAVAPPPLASK